MDHDEPTQKTRPHGIDPKTGKPYKPAEIPVPTRGDVFGDLRKVAPLVESPADHDKKP